MALICSKCKTVKATTEFNKDRTKPSGYYPSCKTCRVKI